MAVLSVLPLQGTQHLHTTGADSCALACGRLPALPNRGGMVCSWGGGMGMQHAGANGGWLGALFKASDVLCLNHHCMCGSCL